MLTLSIPEIIVFGLFTLVYLIAAIVGVIQLRPGGNKYKRLLPPMVSLAVALEAVFLVFRAIEIKAVPLTGLFESMIVLTIVFGLIYLFFSIVIDQVWFGSVMVWIILAIILMTAFVAKPADEPHSVVTAPWAIAHGISMVLGGASITFAAATALLYLIATNKLKRKKVMDVLGKVPNIEKLEDMTLFGLKGSFVLMTIGLASGIGLAAANSGILEITVLDWLKDSKLIMIGVVWILLAVMLGLKHFVRLKGKTIAYMTIIAFVLILFGLIGTTVFCSTMHDFA